MEKEEIKEKITAEKMENPEQSRRKQHQIDH